MVFIFSADGRPRSQVSNYKVKVLQNLLHKRTGATETRSHTWKRVEIVVRSVWYEYVFRGIQMQMHASRQHVFRHTDADARLSPTFSTCFDMFRHGAMFFFLQRPSNRILFQTGTTQGISEISMVFVIEPGVA